MKKIIVTGGSGFVGTNFIKNYSNSYVIKEVNLSKNELQTYDFKGYETLLHLSAIVYQRGIPESKYFEINSELTYKTALKAKHEGVTHFILISTIKVYGEQTFKGNTWTEISECNPVDSYGKSKLDAEKRILSLSDTTFIVTIIRSPLVYGPRVKANMFNLIRLIDKYPFLPFKGIKNKSAMISTFNLCSLIECIIDKKTSGIFLANDNSTHSTTELVETIAKYLNKKRVLFPLPSFIVNLLRLIIPKSINRLWGSIEIDNTKSKEMLQFNPPLSFEESILLMVQYYKTN